MLSKYFAIKSNYYNVVPISKEIRLFLVENFINETDCNDVEICIMETLNNVIKHSYNEVDNNEIFIETIIDKNELKIIVDDKGISRKNITKPTLEYDPNNIMDLPESGMGLYIIDQLMDDTKYYIKDGINTFVMKKAVALNRAYEKI
ncbi:MAG: ATP-binding protein [bacterium]